MAKKRGRSPLLWTFLGLFFHVFAAIVLWFLGNKSGIPQSVVPNASVASPPSHPQSQTTWSGWPDASRGNSGPRTAPQSTPRPAQHNVPPGQNGQIDLNSLRDAVRRSSQGSPQSRSTNDGVRGALEPDRQAFLDSLDANAPTAQHFSPLPLQTGQALRNAWLELGRTFVYSGEAGGITDNNEFYQLEGSDGNSPVLFYPVSQDGTRDSIVVQFAVPLKRYTSASAQLLVWVDEQASNGFARPVAYEIPGTGETLVVAAGVSDPSGVRDDTLGVMCDDVRDVAQRLRQAIPARFGGIWVT